RAYFVAVIGKPPLAPKRSCHGEDVLPNQWRVRRSAEIRKKRRRALEIFPRAINRLQDSPVARQQLLSVHTRNEVQVEQSVVAKALLEKPALRRQAPPELRVGQGIEQPHHGERNR